MWSFFISLLLGVAVGYRVPLSKRVVKWAGNGTTAGLLLLLFTMGAKIGMNDEIFLNLQTMGMRAAVLAGAAVAGSLILIFFWEKYAWKVQASEEGDA